MSCTRDVHDPVGVLQDPLQSMLGEDHGDAEVMDEALQCREDLLRCPGVQCTRGLIEHQHAGV